MTSTYAIPAALGVTGALAVGTMALSFAVDPAETVRLEYPCGIGPCIDDLDIEQWKGGIEFIVFVRPEATPDQVAAIRDALDGSDEVESYTFLDAQAAYDEFLVLFSDKPELIESVAPDVLPASFRVVPVESSHEAVESLGAQFEDAPGVRQVVYASEAVRSVEEMIELRTAAVHEPAFLERNSDWVLRAIAAAMVIPVALLAVALRRSHPKPQPEVL
jgi:hypothetical protein